MLPVPHFDSFGRVVSPSAAARDPYAIPKKDEEQQQARVVLSQDPVIRVMIDDSAETNYESLMKEDKGRLSSRLLQGEDQDGP